MHAILRAGGQGIKCVRVMYGMYETTLTKDSLGLFISLYISLIIYLFVYFLIAHILCIHACMHDARHIIYAVSRHFLNVFKYITVWAFRDVAVQGDDADRRYETSSWYRAIESTALVKPAKRKIFIYKIYHMYIYNICTYVSMSKGHFDS